MYFQAIRGAITVEDDKPEEIIEKTTTLLKRILDENHLSYQDIVSIIFSSTNDIKSQYPAVAARNMGMTEIPLFCCQEMFVEGSLEKCIRVLMHIQGTTPRTIRHIYLEKARSLRPDLDSRQTHGGCNEKASNHSN